MGLQIKNVTCPTCEGKKTRKYVRSDVFGSEEYEGTCNDCNGTGEIPVVGCVSCRGFGTDFHEITVLPTIWLPGGNEKLFKGIFIRWKTKCPTCQGWGYSRIDKWSLKSYAV